MSNIDITHGSSVGLDGTALATLPEADRLWLEAVRADHLRRVASDQRQAAGGRGARTERIEAIVRRAIAMHRPQLNAPAHTRQPRSRAGYLRVQMETNPERYGLTADAHGEYGIPYIRVIRRIVKEAEDQGILNQNAATHRK